MIKSQRISRALDACSNRNLEIEFRVLLRVPNAMPGLFGAAASRKASSCARRPPPPRACRWYAALCCVLAVLTHAPMCAHACPDCHSLADSLSFFESIEADKVSYQERKPSVTSTVTDRESPPPPAPRAVRSNQVVYTTVGGRQASRVSIPS